MKLRSKVSIVGLVLSALYLVFFAFLFIHALIWPQFDGGEWFGMYIVSLPTSAIIEVFRQYGHFSDDKIIRVSAYAVGSTGLWYCVGLFLGRAFRKNSEQ